MDNTMTPRLVELVRADLEWIRKVADAQYEGDPKLRSDAARTLIRISDRASIAISRLMAEGGLSKEPLRPLGPEEEVALKAAKRQDRELKKHLRDLTEVVTTCLAAYDAEMNRTSTPERGRRIATISNALNLQNDIAKRFGLGERKVSK